jgi:uncharacterized membrane protein
MRSSAQISSIVVMVTVGLIFVLGLHSMNYLYFVALALLPAAAAAVIEPAGQRTATISIAALTAATVVPLVLNAITNHRPDLLTRMNAWVFVGVAIAGGIGIFLALPAGLAWREDRRTKTQIRELRRRQEKLEEEWGTEIRTSARQGAG